MRTQTIGESFSSARSRTLRSCTVASRLYVLRCHLLLFCRTLERILAKLRGTRLDKQFEAKGDDSSLEIVFGTVKELCRFVTAFSAQKTALNQHVSSTPRVEYPKFIIKFLKSKKTGANFNNNPQYAPYQQFYGMQQPQYVQYGAPMFYGQPNMVYPPQAQTYQNQYYNNRQASNYANQQPPAFNTAEDVLKRKAEFKKLDKQVRQETLRALLLEKLKKSANPAL